MSRFGAIGGAYQAASIAADNQASINLMPEKVESGAGKSDVILLPTPGLALFATLPDSPLRGEWRVNIPNQAEKSFAVAGGMLFEVFSDGTSAARGIVANDGKPASLASSNIQLMIASGGQGYCLTFATNVLTGPIGTIAGVTQVGYSDGFFVAAIGMTAQIFVSNALDGTTWNPANTAIVSVFPDNIVSMIVDHREICLLGTKQSVCYYDSGNVFPYDVIPGGYAEQGSCATFGAIKADNTVFWIGKDERGQGIAWRAQGYTPTRISTHAIETTWQAYSTLSDAEAYSFQVNGHTVIHWYFPSANDSWDYDVATGLWFQMKFWNAGSDTFTAHRSRCHMFAFGKHLVGDPLSGNIYQMSFPATPDGGAKWNFCTDFGNPRRFVRRSPYLGMAGVWNFINSLEIICEMGLGPEIPLRNPDGTARGPLLMLRWSKDAGKTWSNERQIDLGQIGQEQKRAIFRRLGRFWGSLGLQFEISFADPVPLRLIDADVDADPAMKPIKRLASEIRERA